MHAAARALTRLRSPNRFVAPWDERDEEEEDGTTASGERYRDEEAEDEEEEEGEEDEEEGGRSEDEERAEDEEDVVDLSNLILELNVRQSQQRPPSPRPPPTSSVAPPARRRSSRFSSPPSTTAALVAPTVLEIAVVSALQTLQERYAQQAEQAVSDRLDALQAALEDAVLSPPPSSSSSPLTSYISSSLSSLSSLHAASRSAIGDVVRRWEEFHALQQAGYERRLKEFLDVEERRKREEERRRKALEEQETVAREERKRKEEEDEKRRRDKQAQDEEQQRQQQQEQKRKEEEDQKQKQEQEAKRRQLPSTQPTQNLTSSSSSPLPPSPAQLELQPHVEKLREVRALSASFAGANRLKLKVLINRTITQISQTVQSVQSKAIALVSMLKQAQQASREEYAFVLDTMAAKLVGQGETRVRLQLQSAFSFASVAINLAIADPLFFSVFISHLCERCIYAIPLYLDRRHFPSLPAYMLAMGYEHTAEGVWEEEDAYFERQQGYIALLAAILQYNSASPSVWSLAQGWRWLSRLLNQEPRTATASVLFAFLSTAGYGMARVYGSAQMRKVLMYVRGEVVGRMESGVGVKTAARKASVARLVLWLDRELDELSRTHGLSEPEGRTMPQTQAQDTAQVYVQEGDDRGT